MNQKETPEDKSKIVFTQEHRENLSKAKLGRPRSQAYKDHMREVMTGRKLAREHREKLTKYNRVKVINTATGEVYDSVKECAKALGVTAVSVSQNLKGLTKLCQGQKLDYYDYWVRGIDINAERKGHDGRKRRVVNVNTGEEFPSVAEAAKSVNVSGSAVSRQLNGLAYSCGGERFAYYEDWVTTGRGE